MKAYLFDAYGTLFDIHAAVARLAEKAGPDGEQLSRVWRAKQLEYSWVRTLLDQYLDFWTLTEQALDHAFAVVPSVDRSLRGPLLDAYRTLDCFPEVGAVLRHLKRANARLAILSNGSPAMLESAVRSAGLDGMLDAWFSVDAVKRFKTHPDAYAIYRGTWQMEPAEISFVSSNRWDIAGAYRFGFRTIWINRSGMPDEYADCAPDLILDSLTSLVDDCR